MKAGEQSDGRSETAGQKNVSRAVTKDALERKGYRAVDAGTSADVVEGQCKIVELFDIEVGLFRVEGKVYAVRNYCPHHGAPICRGQIGGTMLPSAPGEYHFGMEGRVLHCPWHHWEYDITTGKSLFGVDRSRLVTYQVETYEVEERGEQIIVWVRPRRDASSAKSPTV